jgi:hypothetical protein
MSGLPEDLVRDCLYNWLGYGNPNAKYWFIGIEESLYRWEGFDNVADVGDFLEIRREFDVTEDFKEAWEHKHGFNLDQWSGISTWLFQAVFLMAVKDESLVHSSDIGDQAREYVFEEKQLGREGGDSLTGEIFPLPKGRAEIEPYDHIWSSESEYQQEVLPGRVQLLTEVLEENPGVEWIISYGITDSNPCAKELRYQYPNERIEAWSGSDHSIPYTLYQLTVNEHRKVNLLHTPFFGMGQTSYEEVAKAAQHFTSG